jgi:hypothetical protein
MERAILVDGIMAVLHDTEKKKFRPIILRDACSKLVWHALMARIHDSELLGRGSAYGRQDGCAQAVAALQHALDTGHTILSLDAKNAFNEIERTKAFQYIASRGNLYYDMYAWLNLFYATSAQCHIFGDDGSKVFSQVISSGASQGCISGPFFLQCALVPILRRHRNIINIADDNHIVIRNADLTLPTSPSQDTRLRRPRLGNTSLIMQQLAEVGLKTNEKTTIFSSLPDQDLLSLSSLFKKITIEHEVASCHGAMVLIDHNTSVERCKKVMMKMFAKAEAKIEFILQAPTSLQVKFLLLRRCQWHQLYYAKCMPNVPQAGNLMNILDAMYFKAVETLFPCVGTVPECHVRIVTPLEDGGLGLLPYAEVFGRLSQSTRAKARGLLQELGFQTDHIHGSDSSTTHEIWRHIFSTLSKNVPFDDERSWLATTPTNHRLEVSDVCFNLAIEHRLGILQPFQYCCPISNIELASLSRQAFSHHLDKCLHCGAPAFRLRHELTVQSIVSTCKYHGLICDSNPKDLPLPGKRRGGPDFVIWGSRVFAGDVCITANKPSTVFGAKIRKYADFVQQTHATCLPFAMSNLGLIDPKTVSLLKEVERFYGKKGLTTDIRKYAAIQCIIGQTQGILRLQNRLPLTNLALPESRAAVDGLDLTGEISDEDNEEERNFQFFQEVEQVETNNTSRTKEKQGVSFSPSL